MAKQLGNYITGTFDDVCFYKMEEQYYVRTKSSLTGKRVKKSHAFVRTMKSAYELAAAAVIASGVYRTIAKHKRKVVWYRKMTGMAKLLFAKGESKEEITRVLRKYILSVMNEKKGTEKFKRKLFTYIKPRKERRRRIKLSGGMIMDLQAVKLMGYLSAPT